MKFTLTIDMNNAAFEDDSGALVRILHMLTKGINDYGYEHADNLDIRDINGNVVGQATITED